MDDSDGQGKDSTGQDRALVSHFPNQLLIQFNSRLMIAMFRQDNETHFLPMNIISFEMNTISSIMSAHNGDYYISPVQKSIGRVLCSALRQCSGYYLLAIAFSEERTGIGAQTNWMSH